MLFGFTKTWGNLVAIFTGIGAAATRLGAAMGGVKAFVELLKEGHGLIPTLAAAFPNLANAVSSVMGAFSSFGGMIGTAVKAVGAFVGGLTAGPILLVTAIITAIASVVVFLKRKW